ncbi:MAG: hypothetical protein IPK76_15525 [Lewinellaceae bacterium]|nr:hypothetical protein [Lewinellaceae bacterium]
MKISLTCLICCLAVAATVRATPAADSLIHNPPAYVPGCALPTGYAVETASPNAIVVHWAPATPGTAAFEVNITPNGIVPTGNPVSVNTGNTHAFTGLEPGTGYSLYLRRVCTPLMPGDPPGRSEWVRISGKTSPYILSDCRFDTTLIAISRVTHERFDIALTPPRSLHPADRRLLVRYRLQGVPAGQFMPAAQAQWQEKLIYNTADLFIDHLYPGGIYEVYITQLRDGSYMDYTQACPEAGPFQVKTLSLDGDCDYAQSVTASCLGAEFVTLHFDGPALGYDDLRYLVAVKPALAPASDWKFYYHFSGPELQIPGLDEQTEYQISAYLLVGQSGFSYDYICSEMLLDNVTTLPRASITDLDGDGIPDGCDPDDTDGPSGDDDGDGIANQDDNDNPPNPFPELPDLACGVAANIPQPNPAQMLEEATPGELFFIHGFPILLSQVTGGNGVFSGNGVIGLPFPSKYLEVEFNNVRVDSAGTIFEGTVRGISEDLNNYPNLALDTVTYGSDRFCREAPEEEGFDENGVWSSNNSEYNPLGFNEDGEYVMPPYQGWEPGDPYDPNYDPNGFDANGNHIETGTPYNPSGCNQVGFNAMGQPCNPGESGPYYWLEGETTLEGIALANEVDDTIKPIVIAHLADLEQQFTDSIYLTKIRCDLTRDSMRNYFYDLGYTDTRDRAYIFGPNDKWFKEGMSREFKSAPQPLGVATDRSVNEDMLESTHINLYNCDKDLLQFESILSIINQMGDEPTISEIVSNLKMLIQKFTPEEVNIYSDIINLEIWINSKVDSMFKSEYRLIQSLGSTEYKELINHKSGVRYNKSINRYSSSGNLASHTDNPYIASLLFQQASEVLWQDVAFDYKQGWQSVAGIDRAYFNEAICEKRLKGNSSVLNNNVSGNLLPLQISKDVLGKTYTLYLDNISFTPSGGYVDVYIIINTNPSPDRLVFRALNIHFGPSGFIGDSKLFLNSDVEITLSNAAKLNLAGNNNTFVSFDCNGFSGMSIDGEVEFCRNYIIPLNPGSLTPKPETESVKAHFIAQMPAWGEFVVELTIDPFALAKHDSIKWQVNRMVFDFSSSVTPSYIHFPENYTSPFVLNNNGLVTASSLWKGFYLDDLMVTLPKQFGGEVGASITIGAHDVIFDDTGISGKVFASPLLSVCEGNLSGWAFSIDTFAIQVTSNRLDGFYFNGLINIPIFSKSDSNCPQPEECVRYNATVLPGNIYSFAIQPLGTYTANVWKATVTLESCSEIEIRFQEGNFLAKANLSGTVNIDGDLGQNFHTTIPEISFQNLILRNQAPYFDPGIWSIPNASVGVGFGGFGLVIDSIKMIRVQSDDNRANLRFRVGLIIVDGAIGLLMVDGGFQMAGKLLTQNSRQRWVYDGFIVDDVSIDASFPGVDRVHGNLSFFGQQQPHPILGRGFSGKVFVDFQGIDVEVAASGLFGNTGDFKYFRIDALARFNPGIGVGVLQLVGFGGGASYHMEIIGDLDTGLPANILNIDPASVALGTSMSNLVYAPNESKGASVHATVVMALAKEEAFNVNATFGISFYSNGGIDNIFFKGTGLFMYEPDFTAPPEYEEEGTPDVPTEICAFVYMSYEFEAKKFHGNFKVSVNVAGILEGEGEAELMLMPGYWFINVGTPKKPVFVNFSIPKLDITIAQVAFYFDIGKNIPTFPGLPGNVATLSGLGNIVANEALRRTGNGFATGMRFDASTGDIDFLIFYARLDLGLGFDLMVQDYGNATCANNNGQPLGINGWYASGQLWAYVKGEVGIKVRLWGKTRRFEILSLSAAAALQAKFPNPFFARGAVGGRYRILGGLVKGNCRFEFKLGEECIMQGGSDPWADQEIIAELNPIDSIQGVHTLTIPKAVFTVPVNENLNDGNNVWRAEIEFAHIVNDGLVLSDEENLLEEKTTLEVKPVNELPSNKWLIFKIKVRVLKNGNIFKYEEKEVAFETGDAPKIIPVDNIQHAYPIDGQYSFYKGEYTGNKGFIKLKFGQPELFQNVPSGYIRTMRVTKFEDDSFIDFPFVYNSSDRKVEFVLPANLESDRAYRLQLINKSLSVDINTKEDVEPIVPPVLYQCQFRISQFNCFADKVEALKQNLQVINYSTGWIRAVSTLIEPLDFYEIYGGDDGTALVNTTFNMSNTPWFNSNKQYLKLIYNYQKETVSESEQCYLSQFTNSYNSFDQNNFSESDIGFDEPLGMPILRVDVDGRFMVNSGSIIQHLDFTSFNAFNTMWGDMKMDLLSYKMLKCSGLNWYGNSGSGCSNLTLCCANSAQQGCCTSECAFEGNPYLKFIADNDMPSPSSGTKFQVMLKYSIPGHGLTTSKVIEIIKP